jgi:putative SOS response-associated peptidase YedK
MCGRFAFAPKANKVEDDIQLIDRDNTLKISYNLSPGMEISTIDKNKNIKNISWGLVPNWSKDLSIGSKLYNARSETAHEKPSFKKAFLNRCLIPATGFYEWKKSNGRNIPYYVKDKNDKIMYFAGICDTVNIEDNIFESVSILTTQPNNLIKSIHNRMPVIININQADFWLEATKEQILQSNIFMPYSSRELEAYRVSELINNSNTDTKKLIEKKDITLF